MAQRDFTPRQTTVTSKTVKANTGSIGPKSRSNFDDQSSVNKVFGWVKENWSKPIPRWVSPSDTPK